MSIRIPGWDVNTAMAAAAKLQALIDARAGQAAKLAVGDWIERVYNRRRRHSAIGMIPPAEYENRITQTAQAA